MIQRVLPDLMAMKNILVLNDEAPHCYREKPSTDEDEDLKGDERKEAEKNSEAARLWISGLKAVKRKLGLARVIDLAATFNDDSILELSPDLVGPTENHNEGIIGEGVNLTVAHLGDMRPST